jgi:hypothetical protein
VDIRKNEDRRFDDQPGRRWNHIHGEPDDISDESGEITEPVTVEEVKHWARTEGFDNSGEFDFDDEGISEDITLSRKQIEKVSNQSLVFHTWRVSVTNENGGVRLPMPPVLFPILLTDEDGNEIENPKTYGGKFAQLDTIGTRMICTYDAGWTTCPDWAKRAIIMQVIYLYEHRGEEFEDKGICEPAMRLALKNRAK